MIHINDTRTYHKEQIATLGWELTVCNMLYPENSPCREVIKKNASYGMLLYEFLASYIDMKQVKTILEAGGGVWFFNEGFFSILSTCSLYHG
ncbi:MAG: hypothetical protein AB1444_00755 [Spirochaetota bacterium]